MFHKTWVWNKDYETHVETNQNEREPKKNHNRYCKIDIGKRWLKL